ncbi:MAG: hypothetical protein OWR62_14205 [Sulfobacillus thermotolerans]|nr:hypothetical protein [Sulfobacillus thermotolerans]
MDYFYLGEMGMGTVAGDSTVVSDVACQTWDNTGDTGSTNEFAGYVIQLNNSDYTYGYWFLLGPKYANEASSPGQHSCGYGYLVSPVSTVDEAFSWGAAQADAAATAWSKYPNVKRSTIFGDVEQEAAAGWYISSDGTVNEEPWYAYNRAVIQGFLEKIVTISFPGGGTFHPGIYGYPDFRVECTRGNFLLCDSVFGEACGMRTPPILIRDSNRTRSVTF